MKTKSGVLVGLVAELLTASTNAGSQVLVARTWPLKLTGLPALLVDPVYSERREATGSAAPEFNTTTTIKVRGRVTSPAGPDDAGSAVCADALEVLKSQVERVLINAYPVMLSISNFPHIETEFTLTSDANQSIGELQMTISMAFIEGPEDFAPLDPSELLQVAIYPDLTNVFDPQGTYSDTPFTPVPAPRTTGPDGRVEGGGLLIDTDI